MKKVIAFLGLIAVLGTLPAFVDGDLNNQNTSSQTKLRTVDNNAFTFGEHTKYRVHYGLVNAGTIELKVKENPVIIKGRPTYHIDGYGRSRSGFDWMFKVRDHFQSYLDTQALVPLQFVKSQKEGGYEDSDFVIFNYNLKKYFSKKGSKEIPLDIQDVISVAYYSRTFPVKDVPIGTAYEVNVYLDNEIFPLKFKIDGRETIDTDLGKIDAVRVTPQAIDGRVFKDKDALKVWISDDDNKLPLRVEAEILVGSVKADITYQSGLKHPITFK